jgi:cysteine desulfurase
MFCYFERLESSEFMNLYFDHAATTKVCDEALTAIENAALVTYGNPSSMHYIGMKAEDLVEEARKFMSRQLFVSDKEIYFTSGGTESNNLAVQGVAKAYIRDGKHIITTKIEHPSVGSTFKQLEDEGFDVTYIDVDSKGYVNLEQLEESIRKDTTLVSIMQVNNEIGCIQNLEAIGTLIKSVNSRTLLHVDGVQGFMKLPISIKRAKIDLYSASSHKIYGPKGSGLLYIKQGTKIRPLQFGGSQQKGIRPGTENVPGIAGFYKAAESISKDMKDNYIKVLALKEYFLENLALKLPKWGSHSIPSNGNYESEISSPYIINFRTISIKGEVVLHALEDYKISVSTGSACSSKKLNISHVLKALNLEDVESDRAVRISFSHHQTKEDIDELFRALIEIDAMFGKFIKR